MLTRAEQVSPTLTVTYTQQRDAENRIAVVTNTTTMSVTRFYYDGDPLTRAGGKRVKKTESVRLYVYSSTAGKAVTAGQATALPRFLPFGPDMTLGVRGAVCRYGCAARKASTLSSHSARRSMWTLCLTPSGRHSSAPGMLSAMYSA
jgi:hypothetical protein